MSARFMSHGAGFLLFLSDTDVVEFTNGFFHTDDEELAARIRASGANKIQFYEVGAKSAPVINAPERVPFDAVDLESSDINTLKQMAKELGIPYWSSKRKQELITLIKIRQEKELV